MTNIFKKGSDYVRDSIEEGRKVTWPSREETIRYSALVIVITILVAAFFGGLDLLFSTLLKLVV